LQTQRLQRGDGVAELAFARRGEETQLSHLFQRDPYRVLFPRPAAGDPMTAVLLTTSGGIAGGDRLRSAVKVGPGAQATVTSQAAEKLYRSLGEDCLLAIELDVAAGALLEWLPQEAILFDGARVVRTIDIAFAGSSRLIAVDMLVFGRTAHGERFRRGLLRDRWRLERDGRLIWTDALHLADEPAAALDHPAGFGGAEAYGTVICGAPRAAEHLEAARQRVDASQARAGVTLLNGILLARFLGKASAVRADMIGYVGAMRHAIAALPERVPRNWYH